MRTRLWIAQAAVVTMSFGALTTCLADRILVPTSGVDETPKNATTTQYFVINNSQTTPFDITLLVVSTTNATPSPTTTNLNWTAESLSASTWTQTMGGGAVSLLTWQQYTGMTYVQAFPTDPTLLNGYFLNYTFDSVSGDVAFAAPPHLQRLLIFGGFFFQGATDSNSTFLVEGPSDASVPSPPSSFQSLEGNIVINIPEPATISLCLFAFGAVVAVVRRRER